MAQKKTTVTLKVIASKTNFSVNTVSKVLSGQSKQARISDKTRKIIKDVADQLGYIPNQMARNLRAKNSGQIGVFIAETSDPVCTGTASAVLVQLPKRGYFPVLTVAEAGLELCYQSWLRNRVEAVIFCGTNSKMDAGFFQNLKQDKFPVVIAGNHYVDPQKTFSSTPPATSVRINNEAGIEIALNHLHQQGKERIAFIAGPAWHYDATQRRSAYQTLIQRYHNPIIADLTTQEQRWKRGYQSAELLYNSNEKFDAIVTYDDLVAIGAMRWLNEHGISIPNDVAIIGFDNLPQCEYTIPSLSSIAQPVELLANKCVELLVSHLKSNNISEHVLLTPSLVIRESTRLH